MILIDGKPDARIDPLDRGFTYGDGVFRTMRTSSGRVLHLRRHLDKLARDCARLDIPCPADDLIVGELQQVARSHPDGVTKIVLTRGAGGRGYSPVGCTAPTRVVYGFPLPSATGLDRSGVRVRWCRTPVTMQPALAGIKHLNRLDSVLARKEWREGEFEEGLMTDRDGWVVEGTMTNVFVLEGSRLSTPILDQAGVAGVQRDRLLALASRIGIQCEEQRIGKDRLLAADAVYLTNSIVGMWWVAELGNRRWARHSRTPELLALVDSTIDD